MSTQAKSLKKLQKEWAKKLKDSGFSDAEYSDGTLKDWHSFKFKTKLESTPQEFRTANALAIHRRESATEYYRLAGHFLHEYVFKDQTEKLIWQLHADGKGMRAIIKELKRRDMRGHFDFVGDTIRRLVKEMKNRY